MALTATRTANPWRFAPGDHVYIAGHPQEPAIITSRVRRSRANWPHYFVVDADGHEWLVPQIHLSSSLIQA
jgi:hypothetical protein